MRLVMPVCVCVCRDLFVFFGLTQGARNAGQLTTDRREKVDPSIERAKNAT